MLVDRSLLPADQTLAVPYNNTIQEYSAIRRSVKSIRYIIDIPNAIILGFFHEVKCDVSLAAVFAFNENSVNVGIYRIGNGVFERRSSYCASEFTNLYKLSIDAMQESELKSIDVLVILSDTILDTKYVSLLESVFQVKACVRKDLKDLCKVEASINTGCKEW